MIGFSIAYVKKKLVYLWINKRKKAFNIICNNGCWPSRVSAAVSLERNEEYYRASPKYVIESSYQQDSYCYFVSDDLLVDPIDYFTLSNIEEIVKGLPNGKSAGVDGVYYEDLK